MKRKIKLKDSAKKMLYIIGGIIVVLIIIFMFYLNKCNQLKNLGYSSSAVHNIMKSFSSSKVMKIGKNKMLNAAFESSYYNEKYFNRYPKIEYQNQKNIVRNVNLLIKKGYTNNEISLILKRGDDDDVYQFAKRDRVKYLEKFLSVSYAKLSNYDRYLAYQEKENNDEETTVLYVNMDFDKENYVDYKIIDKFDSYVLVNKHRQLSAKYVPTNLVSIKKEYVKGSEAIKIEKTVANAFYKMAEDASKDNLSLMVSSGYRSFKDQEETNQIYLNLYGQKYVDNYVAKPGFSEHQTAMSLDIASKSVNVFVNSDEYTWMMDNGYKYGFILRYPKSKEDITGYKCEAWHFRYVGKKIAKYIKEHNITYDEYYVMFLDK